MMAYWGISHLEQQTIWLVLANINFIRFVVGDMFYKGGNMANKIYKKEFEECPRCKNKEVRISIYHFGATYQAECSLCALGRETGDDEDTALARLRGRYREYNKK